MLRRACCFQGCHFGSACHQAAAVFVQLCINVSRGWQCVQHQHRWLRLSISRAQGRHLILAEPPSLWNVTK